ncbi:MAG TPA: hypothetical protein VI997_06025, partial [Candidatus Thermoplasmatota archaeon]|nr:hypothetical protein [Candidatus Thermoplasmatota archaeon]
MGVLVVFGALASALPLPGTPAEDAPECVREGPHDLLCVWDWRASPGGGMRHWLMPPGVGTSILEMRITTDTVLEFSWGFCIDAGSPNETVAYCPSTVLEHPPPPRGTDRTTTVTRTLVLDFDPALVYHFMIAPTSASLAPTVAPATYHVEGDFRGVSRDIPAGGHAGTPEDPQLRDGAGDTADASVVTGDIRGGWIDQAYLDDRLLEVGLVLPNLEAIDKSGNEESTFTFTFTVLGRSHTVAWLHGGRADDRADGWAAVLFDSNDPVTPSLFSLPTRIDAANGTIRATLALRAVGDPQDGELFSNLSATASRNMAVPGNDHGLVWFTQLDEIEAGKTQDDAATSMVRAFAPGGPAVWEPLRGVEAASVPAPSWKSAPFAPQNLASTLVLGAVLVLVVGGVASTVLVRGRVASLATDARARGIVVAPGALVLGKYRVERALGEGGGGRVYLAQDVRMDRRVVLKVLASQDQAEA